MRIFNKLGALTLLLLAAAGCGGGGGGGATTAETALQAPNPVPTNTPFVANLTVYHAAAASHPTAECISCHGPKVQEVGPHPTHVQKVKLSCTYCHGSVDLSVEATAGNLRRQVTVALCAGCHQGQMGTNIKWYMLPGE